MWPIVILNIGNNMLWRTTATASVVFERDLTCETNQMICKPDTIFDRMSEIKTIIYVQ